MDSTVFTLAILCALESFVYRRKQSHIIMSIGSTLERLEYKADAQILKRKLRVLRTFLLCSTKLSTRIHVGSLLVRVEHFVYKMASDDRFFFDYRGKLGEYLVTSESLEEEVDKWYISVCDYYLQQSNFAAAPDQVKDIVDSILENLEDFLRLERPFNGFLVEPIEALKENITFLRNLISFATLVCAENQDFQDLLAQFEALVISAAHLTVHLLSRNVGDLHIQDDEIKSSVCSLLIRIRPIDNPNIYGTYTRALESLMHSRELYIPTLNVKDAIDFLLSILWEMLQVDARPVVSFKDQLQALYEGLRSLKHKFDGKTRDAIFDVGVIIFSLHQKDFEIDHRLADLVQNINSIWTLVEGKVVKTSRFNTSMTTVLGFLDFLMDYLKEVPSCENHSNSQSFVLKIQEDLVFLRSLMGKLVELRNQHEGLQQALWDHALEVVYKIEFLIDQLVLGNIMDSFSTSFQSITEDIMIIKADSMKIFDKKRPDIKKYTWASIDQVPSQSSTPADGEVIGFEVEKRSLINRLMRGSENLQVVAIVGMPGLGKTTLATNVYSDPSITCHFHVRAWCSVSQVFNRRKVLLQLLNHIRMCEDSTMNEDDLSQLLWRSLKRRRYLILVDDVWDIEAFNWLKESFPNDSTGSRILLTSRHCDVAILDQEPHLLRQLTDAESLELLQKKLLFGKDWSPMLSELGEEIAQNCKGLPLTIVIVAGLLTTEEPEVWKEVLESLRLGIISGTDQCMSTIELSYKHLPDHLKPCFLSLGAFPEDYWISVKRLIWLWVAEGFVRKSDSHSLEDVASDYLMTLISRSLIMNAGETSRGDVKVCRVHDLLHDFCLRKASEENFMHLLSEENEDLSSYEPSNLRRLCVHATPERFEEAKLFCPRLRSLLFFHRSKDDRKLDISFVFRVCKLIRVLDVERADTRPDFLSEIGVLVQLRYLEIRAPQDVSPSIGNLSNLETLILHSRRPVSLPDAFWKLQKLRHLHLTTSRYRGSGCIRLPVENLDSFCDLLELETLSGLRCDNWIIMEKQLRKFPNIRKLKCKLSKYEDDPVVGSQVMAFSFLNLLETLSLTYTTYARKGDDFEFIFPDSINKLTLSHCPLPGEKISRIARLPNLEVLKLRSGSFIGDTWNVEEGEFSKLKFLELSYLDIVKWTTSSDEEFSNLEKLVLYGCRKLEEIPECLENVATLSTVEVSDCPIHVASLVRKIEEFQKDFGNSDLKVLLH